MRRYQIGWVVLSLVAALVVGCSGGGGDDGPKPCTGDGECGGLTCCSGSCVDLEASEAHCGACGAACAAGGTCCSGGCVDTDTSASHCGACGTSCPAVTNGTPGCSAAACGIASCDAGFASCDAQAANGCEVDTTSNVANCGGCGTACPTPANGTAGCSASTCGVASCDAGFANCDATAANGCEVNTTSDVANCGGCGTACPTPANGTAGCSASTCGIASCNPGFASCDGQAANGCEVNTISSPAHCGGCGLACPAVPNGTPGCSASTCGVGSCYAGFANCDLNAANGCETGTASNLSNCGGCGVVCPAVANGTPGCSSGVCGVASCTGSFANCDGQAANGCERNTASDLSNCGACGNVCSFANATPSCSAGTCGITSCNAGFANCDGTLSNGCEANTNTSPSHCGACGVVCGAGQACSAGVCKDKVLVVGAPSQAAWNDDVAAKLVSTAAFAVVDVFDADTATPTLAQLQPYAAVLVYSDVGFASATTLGDNLASYFDAGGRVVVAPFANASVALGGRWSTGGYALISAAGQSQNAEAGALQLVEPSSPLLTGVASLTATAAYRSTGALINGAVRVANWGSGAPLVVRGQKNGRARVELNFYPPSITVRADFWTGSGAALMANALKFKGYCHSIVGTGGNTCPSTKREFCDPVSALSALSAAQAKLACDTCYGISCFLETADCSGSAYGPRPAGQYVAGEAYFGYTTGCGGAAGRIWPITNSYTTLGRWAP